MKKNLFVILSALLSASAAAASAIAAPELDPASLASGLGLAAAIVLALSGRR